MLSTVLIEVMSYFDVSIKKKNNDYFFNYNDNKNKIY